MTAPPRSCVLCLRGRDTGPAGVIRAPRVFPREAVSGDGSNAYHRLRIAPESRFSAERSVLGMTAVSGSTTRERIVEAAQGLIYVQGYHETSFTDIARAADIPRGNFYHYFKTKDAILRSVIDRWLQTLRRFLTDLEGREHDPRKRILGLVRLPVEHAEALLNYGCPYGSLNVELGKRRPDEVDSADPSVLLRYPVEWLEVQFRGMGRDDDGYLLALQTLGRLQGAAVMCNALGSRDYLDYEVSALEEWIQQL